MATDPIRRNRSRTLNPKPTHPAYNIQSVGGRADVIYAGHQVCGFLTPTFSPAMVSAVGEGRVGAQTP